MFFTKLSFKLYQLTKIVKLVIYSYQLLAIILYLSIRDYKAKNFTKSLICYYLPSFTIRNRNKDQIYYIFTSL